MWIFKGKTYTEELIIKSVFCVFSLLVCCFCSIFFLFEFLLWFMECSLFLFLIGLSFETNYASKVQTTHTQKSLTCACIFFLVPHVFSKGCKKNEVANLYFAYYKYATFNLKYNLMWSYFKWLFRFPFTTAHMKTNVI